MKSTKIFFTLLIFSIAVAFTGCPGPVGSLLYSLDYIKAVPSKTLYGQNDWFKPAEHVKVIGIFGGAEDEIGIDKVKIKIIEDPLSTPNEIIVDDNQRGRVLEKQGPKAVVITYNNMEARYDIAVGAPGVGNVGWGDSGGGGEGITVIYW